MLAALKEFARNFEEPLKQRREWRKWERNGRPMPPPHLVKQGVLLEYARRYGLRTLVETGTQYGAMVHAMKRHFDRIISIELSPELHQKTKRRFRRDVHVRLICGDSGKVLGEVVPALDQPALFWLDGHYSGGVTAKGKKDTPIFEELEHIFKSAHHHVVIIDDARQFGSNPAYPSIEELKQFALSRQRDAQITVEQDSIRITRMGDTSR